MTKTKRKIDARRSEDRGGGVAGTSDGERPDAALSGSPEPVYAWKKQLLDNAALAFDPKSGWMPRQRRRARSISFTRGRPADDRE